VWLDKFTVRNLELLFSPNEASSTLLSTIDKTISPMGSRLLKRWILLPLKDRLPVTERLEIVDYFLHNESFTEVVEQHIKIIGDLERLISKVAVSRVNPVKFYRSGGHCRHYHQ